MTHADVAPSGAPSSVAPAAPIAPLSIVILSARATNLVPCIRSILRNEPALDPSRIVVVDDGARAEAEAELPGVRWVDGASPFVYARNANLGIRATRHDVMLVNDDLELLTPGGFSALAATVRGDSRWGLGSAVIKGSVGNRRQTAPGWFARMHRTAFSRDGMLTEPKALAFVCVYIPRHVFDTVGPLDERFTGYGLEDLDYCVRVRNAGWKYASYDGCVVQHPGARATRSFVTRPDLEARFEENRQHFKAKYGITWEELARTF